MESIWKPVAGYENYQVSDMGEVRNARTGRVLSPKPHNYGYRLVDLCIGGTPSTKTIHRLVANAFIPNPDNKPCVDHIHGVQAGDMMDNLRWATNSENSHNAGISKRNKSGYKGVSFNTQNQKYSAFITLNKKRTYLGSFNTAAEGHAAYCAAAAANYGEFACNG